MLPIVEIEIDMEHNRNTSFRPVRKIIRGAFRLTRCIDREAMTLIGQVPDFPGQRIRLDFAKAEGQIIEPIHRDKALMKVVAANNMRLEDEVTTFQNIDVDEWAYWMKRLVQTKCAHVTEGKLPDVVNYDPPANPDGPKPLRGDARKREIFRQHPDTAAQYLEWPVERQQAWEKMVGV